MESAIKNVDDITYMPELIQHLFAGLVHKFK